jgi:two-component system, CitB family, sensor kinase
VAVTKRKLSTQILVSQLIILVATVLIGFALSANAERDHLDRQYRERALAIAKTVASVPLIREAMEYGDSGGAVQSTAERIRRASGAAYVVVIDLQGIRHSHPTPALVGKPVEEPLVTMDYTGVDNGSLGLSANGKTPIYGPSGNLVGEVSAGILESEVTGALARERPIFAVYFGVALALGAAASYLLAWRLKRSTFGLELHEFATLLQEREAMLHGIREGVIAFDRAGRVTVINDEARRLLGIGGAAGQPLDDLLPPGRLRDLLAGTAGGQDEIVLTDQRCLAVNRMPVHLRGRELGAVVTVRDRTELVGVLRELDNVRGLSDALRAQQHEFANQMHTVAGLIELGDPAQALAFITEVEASSAGRVKALQERIGSPLIAALILAKQTVATERGVDLQLSPESVLDEMPAHPQTLLTVLGNLLDNAIDAAASAPPPAVVYLNLSQSASGTTVEVADTGPGIQPKAAEAIFQDGYSTKPARGHVRRGLGLALVHRVVARLGGTVTVATSPGATFTVWLPPGDASGQAAHFAVTASSSVGSP